MTHGVANLPAMHAEMRRAPEIVRPSAFWQKLCDEHAQALDLAGFESFKWTVNDYYFQWRVASRSSPSYRAAVREFRRRPHPAIMWARVEDAKMSWLQDAGVPLPDGDPGDVPPGTARARLYARYVAMLWEIAGGQDVPGLEEPEVGRPLIVRHRGRRITQDLANSLIETRAILDSFPPGALDGGLAIDLGGGYGRLTWMLMRLAPGLRVIAVDIPPALAVAEEYLLRVLPGRRIVPFAAAADGAELTARIAGADLAFLTPNQLMQLEPLDADLLVNVSSLHEMRPEQIDHYLREADRHVEGYVYTKQWVRWFNHADGIETRQDSYPYPERWGRVFERDVALQPDFFEALFRTR